MPTFRFPGSSGVIALLVVAGLLAAAPESLDAQDRSLSWPRIDVEARLDADGVLHVQETQTMAMDGAWNGGERTFDLSVGRMDFEALWRRDSESGDWRQLPRGDLAGVDRWSFTDRQTLRWRSRLPTDPPFDDALLTYRLHYRYEGILWPVRGEEDTYELDHDFAFTQRDGLIREFSLRLELDPVWRGRTLIPPSPVTSPLVVERRDVPPGQGVIVVLHLEHTGDAPPAGAGQPPPRWPPFLACGLALLGLGLLLRDALRRERDLGRLDPLPALDEDPLDAEAVAEELASWEPEVLGAAWDQRVGAAEVAAVIARMVAEDRIESQVEGGRWTRVLVLRRLVDLDEFKGYDGKIIRKLFFNQRRNVDTRALRKHYRKSGLDLVKILDEPLERKVQSRLGDLVSPEGVRIGRTAWPLLLALVLFGVDVLLRVGLGAGLPDVPIVFLGLAVTLFYAPLLVLGISMARRVAGIRRRLAFLAGLAALEIVLAWGVLPLFVDPLFLASGVAPGGVSVLGALGRALFLFGLLSSAFHQARSRLHARGIAGRRRLAQVRRWLARELGRPSPRLRDEWFPHLVALGLGGDVDRWFGRFGGAASAATKSVGSSMASSGSAASFGGSSWSGGGGRFGGAGATAAWAGAATSLGGGVSSSSSSGSSGSSGGGGGGSSGGGGGGGW